jgi:hypothetical protein
MAALETKFFLPQKINFRSWSRSTVGIVVVSVAA